MEIKNYEFSSIGRNEVLSESKGRDWPVVYLINDNKNIYIGETSNFYNRFGQHLDNTKKRSLKQIHVIFDDEFNKSAVLDIEQTLIRLCSADQKFTLLNGNSGQSSKHNYYQREKYLNKLEGSKEYKGIWDSLRDMSLADNTYQSLVNSDLFTYSPYTTLTVEQEEVCFNVINNILNGLQKGYKNGTTCIINGSAGTGKTILAIYIMSLFVNVNMQMIDTFKDEESFEYASFKNKVIHKLKKYVEENGELRIGYVLPMTSIRRTLQDVFRKSKNGLKSQMVIGPTDVTNDAFDLLLVDETHRLPKRKNISWMGEFDKCCKKLGLDPEKANTLDWIIKNSKNRILFYDKEQSIKASDISNEELYNSISKTKIFEYKLTSQLRCDGGKLYIDYVDKFFKCAISNKTKILNYEIKVFDDPNEMIDSIKSLNDQFGLCRNVAGYSWEWKTKGKNLDDIKSSSIYDIELNGKTYCWNMTNSEWILRKESINEIGCIHTTQGYDLNYVGVILGREIDYDPINNEIIIDPSYFYDTNVKKGSSPEELKRYIINSYKVMMERGIKGCYLYACNKNMREYLKKYFN